MADTRPPLLKAKQDAFGDVTDEYDDGEVLSRIPTPVYTMACGLIAVTVAGLAFVDSFSAIANFDLLLNFVLFLVAGLICLGAGKERPDAVPGVVVTAVGVLVSSLHLLFFHDHPWFH
ncbi:MAG: hypothetical protein GY747_12270 [Planctomycetes bacterium]|nr:hypothetical protein [Planctomycetota bacterium]MCP4771768.1 hypothetical protein [Planctomycetota bacterium]MCP4860989.1 hypothetical protein [Planctomycetota bacterium]